MSVAPHIPVMLDEVLDKGSIAFAFLICVLMLRPSGLFARS